MLKNLAVVGLGKLGSCVAATFANAGYSVIATDTDDKKRLAIANRIAPVDEPGLQELLESLPPNVLSTTANIVSLVLESEACFFVVPTPSLQNGKFDNSYVLTALRNVAKEVKIQGKQNYAFVINSTVNPGSCDSLFYPELKAILGDLKFKLYYKPELIALGTVLYDLIYPELTFIGMKNPAVSSQDDIHSLYRSIVKDELPKFKHLTFVEAELAKISLNCFITMKISFANQLALTAKKYKANANEILTTIGMSPRIGHRCLRPGLPFGGPCFPRDNRMFTACADFAPLAEATDQVNQHIKYEILKEAITNISSIEVQSIGILGMAYKPHTSITIDALGPWLQKILEDDGYMVKTFDPEAACNSTKEEVLKCDVIIVACAWPEFENLTIENRRVVDPEHIVKEFVCG